MIADLPSRLARRVSFEWAQRRLVRDVEQLVSNRPRAATSGPRVGFATFGCGCWHLGLETLLAHALQLRGATVEMLICDLPDLPICVERTIHSKHQDRCDGCVDDKRPLLEASQLSWRGLSSVVPASAVDEARSMAQAVDEGQIESFSFRGWPIGQWLHVAASHFLRSDARGQAAEKVETRRRLLATAMVAVEAIDRWLDTFAPDIIVVQGGAYVMWRAALEQARARGIPVVCREMGKGGWDSHIYALNADSMSPDLEHEWQRVKGRPLSASEDADVDAFVNVLPAVSYSSRAAAAPDKRDLRTRFSIPADCRLAVAFTNVTWDLATAGRDVGFAGMLDWLQHTVATFARMSGTHLMVRVHPAELDGGTRERAADAIQATLPAGVTNVTVVGPEDPMAARDLFNAAGLVLAYNSTAAIEAAIGGATVVLAGDCHFRGKGFTLDPDTRDAYDDTLARWIGGDIASPSEARALARRYLHLFFLRYQVRMGWTTSPLAPPYQLRIQSLDELRPGRNAGLDAVCDGILSGRQIILPSVEESACVR